MCFVDNSHFEGELRTMEEVCAQQAQEIEDVSRAYAQQLEQLSAEATALGRHLGLPRDDPNFVLSGGACELGIGPGLGAFSLNGAAAEGECAGSGGGQDSDLAVARLRAAVRRRRAQVASLHKQVARQGTLLVAARAEAVEVQCEALPQSDALASACEELRRAAAAPKLGLDVPAASSSEAVHDAAASSEWLRTLTERLTCLGAGAEGAV